MATAAVEAFTKRVEIDSIQPQNKTTQHKTNKLGVAQLRVTLYIMLMNESRHMFNVSKLPKHPTWENSGFV